MTVQVSSWQEMAGRMLFQKLWANYRALVPQVQQVEDSLRAKGEVWSEDHVAYRTLPSQFTGSSVLQQAFELLGYQRVESLRFEDKKLNAFWLCPPGLKNIPSSRVLPKVFVSELDTASFSKNFIDVLQKHTSRVSSCPVNSWKDVAKRCELASQQNMKSELAALTLELVDGMFLYFSTGAPWGPVPMEDYECLRKESEYAAWTLVYGPQANHFTVSIHLMKQFSNLEEFNADIEQGLSIPLNQSGGGKVKGGPQFKLEQSATLAAPRKVLFQDGLRELPYAFIEFAFRFRTGESTLTLQEETWDAFYQGFVVSNADKIFESTNVV